MGCRGETQEGERRVVREGRDPKKEWGGLRDHQEGMGRRQRTRGGDRETLKSSREGWGTPE